LNTTTLSTSIFGENVPSPSLVLNEKTQFESESKELKDQTITFEKSDLQIINNLTKVYIYLI
jgi:hypothetical protein